MPTTIKQKALVIEDQTTFRELLCELLEATGKYDVWACGSGTDALGELLRRKHDLVLLDLMLPDMHGLELLPRLAGSRVLILTAQAKPQVMRDAMGRGAHGVVTKGARLAELREAIDRVSHGGVYYSDESSQLLREAMVQPERDLALTERQREILRGVAHGLSTKEIASQLGLSDKTVTNHRARIMERLGLRDVASLTRYAVANGLVEADP